MSKLVDLSKETIDECFVDVMSQEGYMLKLYAIVFPNWEDIVEIDGWGTVHKETWLYISTKAMHFDKDHHPNVMPGGLWMNKGFSQGHSDQPEWTVDLSQCKIKLKDGSK